PHTSVSSYVSETFTTAGPVPTLTFTTTATSLGLAFTSRWTRPAGIWKKSPEREGDGLLSVSTIVEPEPSGDEEPIQVSRPMMMPRRDRPDRNLRPHHDHVLVLERSVSTDPLGDRARCQMVLADDLDRWHEPDTRPPSITV